MVQETATWMYKLDLGEAVAIAPFCYKNFINAHRDKFKDKITRPEVNLFLSESGANAVLRRTRLKKPRSVFNVATWSRQPCKHGSWYLEFKSKRDYTAFVLRWG